MSSFYCSCNDQIAPKKLWPDAGPSQGYKSWSLLCYMRSSIDINWYICWHSAYLECSVFSHIHVEIYVTWQRPTHNAFYVIFGFKDSSVNFVLQDSQQLGHWQGNSRTRKPVRGTFNSCLYPRGVKIRVLSEWTLILVLISSNQLLDCHSGSNKCCNKSPHSKTRTWSGRLWHILAVCARTAT